MKKKIALLILMMALVDVALIEVVGFYVNAHQLAKSQLISEIQVNTKVFTEDLIHEFTGTDVSFDDPASIYDYADGLALLEEEEELVESVKFLLREAASLQWQANWAGPRELAILRAKWGVVYAQFWVVYRLY